MNPMRRMTNHERTAPGPLLAIICAAGAAALTLPDATALASGDFYEGPLSTLPDYLKLDQLPAKSAEDIHEELAKAPAKAPDLNFTTELLGLTKKPGAEALASLDTMIAAARTQANYPLLNLLHDLRDLFAGPANAAETTEYVEWRLEQADQFGVALDKRKGGKEGKPAEEPDAPKPPDRELIADIQRHLAKASPALKPHWLYLRGAAEYRGHQIAESEPWFLKVVSDFPKSPRAEVALYMAARCQMWRTRSQDYTQQDMKLIAAERPKAKKLFDEYFARFPRGTHVGDMLGWYAAYAFDGGDFATALRYYVEQLDLPDHPELTSMAAEMIEKTLSHIASKPNDKVFAEVAKYPKAAQALVYLVINTSESDNFNGKIDPIDEVRGWRKKVLPRLATAISTQAKLYQSVEWKPRYLAMLAYAISGGGQQEQAIKLLESAGAATEQSDDLLMARGVVLHRAHRPGDAVTALEMLLQKFPDSPLVEGARLRLALALTDDHRAGQAVLALQKLLPAPKPAGKPEDAAEPPEEDTADGVDGLLYSVETDQVRALIDVLLNFAPVEELAGTAQTPGLDAVQRLAFTEAIAQRLLAKEQFDEAKKFLTPAQFGLAAAGLAGLTEAVRKAKDPAERAAACLKLGDAWAAARGKLLTYPLDTTENRRKVYLDAAASANIRRAESAPFIGAAGNYRLDLENRDELRHAFNWWLEASDAQPGTPLTAQALWRALKAMPQIADVSPYTVERAAARKWAEVARKLYDRLRTECPDSIEARRYAVTWNFPEPKKPNPDEGLYSEMRDAAGGRYDGGAEMETASGTNDEEWQQNEALARDLATLETEAGGPDVHKALSRAQALQKQVRGIYTTQYGARWVNLMDDLVLFLAEPDPGAAVRKRYVGMRFRFTRDSAVGGTYRDEAEDKDPDETLASQIKAALADPASKPVADYFEFLRLAVIANHITSVDLNPNAKKPAEIEDIDKDIDTYRTRDYPLLEKETRAFLDKYPHSKKREAATLLYARAVFRASEDIRLRKLVSWPQGARWEGGYEFRHTQQEPFDAKRVLAALDAYEHAYPNGRYAPDIRNYRAEVAVRLHDWKPALNLTIDQLTGHANPGITPETIGRLNRIFALLADEQYRADIVVAIKENKAAQGYLKKYLADDNASNPLLYLKVWLRQELGLK